VIVGEIVQQDDGTMEVPLPIETPKGNRELTAAEKQRSAMQLRMMGASYAAIAQQVGYADASGAHRAVKAGMANARQDGATDLRDMNLTRLETLLMLHWPKALKGDETAAIMCLQIMDRIERLGGLSGLPIASANDDDGEDGVLVVGGNSEDYINTLRKQLGTGGSA
jgi:hypothetical protein